MRHERGCSERGEYGIRFDFLQSQHGKQPINLQDFSKTRQDLFHAGHLSGKFYTSPEIFQKEIEQIFMKNWPCVGRVEQYTNPGDYRALWITGHPPFAQLLSRSHVRDRGVELSPSIHHYILGRR